jgi:lipopolysaccharide transport system permease protein
LSALRTRVRVFAQFFQREIKNRYLGSLSGLLWVFLHPALLMLMYATIIGSVLKARIPGVSDAQWLPYVALGLWPWLCFSEGLQRGTQAVLEHAGLIGKVAIPSDVLVAANVAATFVLHVSGMFVMLILLKLLGYPLLLAKLPLLALLLVCLFALTLGLAWIAASMQVYVRDVGQFLGQALSFMFFLTPIIYAPTMLPEAVQRWLLVNPVSFYCTSARDWLLLDVAVSAGSIVLAVLIAGTTLVLGQYIFQRLSGHFEDYL